MWCSRKRILKGRGGKRGYYHKFTPPGSGLSRHEVKEQMKTLKKSARKRKDKEHRGHTDLKRTTTERVIAWLLKKVGAVERVSKKRVVYLRHGGRRVLALGKGGDEIFAVKAGWNIAQRKKDRQTKGKRRLQRQYTTGRRTGKRGRIP